MDPAKDVDGFHPLNVGRLLMRGSEPAFVPCTALGCMQLLMRSGVDVRGKSAVILVRSSNAVYELVPDLFRLHPIEREHLNEAGF